MRASPGRFRRFVVRPAFWGLAALALILAMLPAIVRSPWARDLVRQEVEVRMESVLGRNVAVERLDYSLLPLELRFEGVSVADLQPGLPPIVEAERVVMALRLPAWRVGRVEISRLEIERPILRIALHEKGDNLPRFERKAGGSRWKLDMAALAVKHGSLELGMERKIPFSLEARGVEAEALGIGPRQLEGQARVASVEVALPEDESVALEIHGRLRLGPGELRLADVRLRGEDLEAAVRGRIDWGELGRADFQIQAEGDLGWLRRLGHARPSLEGRASYVGELGIGRGEWGFQGSVAAEDLRFEGRRVRGLEGQLSGDRDGMLLEVKRARHAGGGIDGRVALHWGEGSVRTELDLGIEGLDLEMLCSDSGIPLLGVGSLVDGVVSYGFEGNGSQVGLGWADLRIRPSGDAHRLGLEGDAAITIRDGEVTMQTLELEGQGQRLLSSGRYRIPSRSGEFSYSVLSEDLAPIERVLVRSLDLDEKNLPLWLPSSGRGKAEGELSLAARGPATDLRVDLQEVLAKGFDAEQARGAMHIGRSGVEALRLELGRGTEQALLVTGRFGSDIDLAIDAFAWPVSVAQPWLSFALPLEGPVSGRLRLEGESESLHGELEASMASAKLDGRAVGELALMMRWQSEWLEIERSQLAIAGGVVSGEGRIGLESGLLDLDFEASGIDTDHADVAEFLPGLAGKVAAKVHVSGSLEQPQVVAHASSLDLRAAGSPEGEIARSSVDLQWDRGTLTAVGSLHGLLDIEGGGRLQSDEAELRFDLRSQNVEALLASIAPDAMPRMQGSLAGGLRVSASSGSAPEIELVLDRLEAAYREHRVANLEPVVIRWQPGGLEIESFYLGSGEQAEVFASGQIHLEGDPELDLRLQGNLLLGWLEWLYPELHAEGRLDFLGSLKGRLSSPEVDGVGEIVAARALVDGFPHAFEKVSGVLLFYPGQVVLDGVQARMAEGSLLFGGQVELDDEGDVAYQLQLRARGVAPRWSDGWLVRGDADLSLVSEAIGRQIRGSIRLDRAFFLEDVSLDPVRLLVSLLERQRREVGSTDELLTSTLLDVAVEVPDSLRVRNKLAELDGRATLALRGSLARPAVFGRVDLEPGGSLVYAETDYRLERGSLTFANPYRIEPIIDLVATTEIREYDVTLSLVGTFDQLQPTFTSSPPLPDLDVIRLLLTRQGPASRDLIALEDSDSRGVGAAALLYGQAASMVSDRFSTLFGLDTLRIQPLSTGSDDFTSSTAVTVGKQLTGDLYASYTYDPTSTGERQLRVEWSIGAGKLLVLTQNSDGSYSADLQLEKRY